MYFYMSERGIDTLTAIRQGIRTATSRDNKWEIDLIKGLKVGQPVLFVKPNTRDLNKIDDRLIVFATPNEDGVVGYPVYTWWQDEELISKWCQLEGWDVDFARRYLKPRNNKKEIWQFQYSLYPPSYNYSPDNITELKDNEIFVWGSNKSGIHGAGAALFAMNNGAIYGQAEGLQGKTYAIITTDLTKSYRPSVDISLVTEQVNKFMKFAIDNPQLTFLVTEVGCGLAGFTVEQIAPLFKSVLLNKISNVRLPKSFIRHLIVSSIEACLNHE